MQHRTGLILGMAWLCLTAGVASAAEPAAPSATADAKATKDAPRKKATADVAKCTQAPGSHIKLAKPEDCDKVARGPYRSFSKEELENTGESNLGEALRKLDPRFQ